MGNQQISSIEQLDPTKMLVYCAGFSSAFQQSPDLNPSINKLIARMKDLNQLIRFKVQDVASLKYLFAKSNGAVVAQKWKQPERVLCFILMGDKYKVSTTLLKANLKQYMGMKPTESIYLYLDRTICLENKPLLPKPTNKEEPPALLSLIFSQMQIYG